MNCLRPAKHVANILRKFISGETDNTPLLPVNISKMIRLGLVEAIETDNKYAPNFKITDDGIKAYQEHTFQTLATSSFFNYQTYQLNKKADRMSKLMLAATIASVLVAILSVIVTIWVARK